MNYQEQFENIKKKLDSWDWNTVINAIEKMVKRLDDAEEALKWYGDKDNWMGAYSQDHGDGSMIVSDYEFDKELEENIGGVKAREYFKKYS